MPYLEHNGKKYLLNAQRSPLDPRDFKIAKAIPEAFDMPKIQLPTEYIQPYIHPAKDQGSIGSCFDHAMAYNDEIALENKILKEFIEVSAQFLYAYRKPTDWQGSGLIGREALDNRLHIGNVYRKIFDKPGYEYPAIAEFITSQLIEIAKQFLIKAYYKLDTIDEVHLAKYKGMGIIFTIPIFGSFEESFENGGKVPLPGVIEKYLGEHGVCYEGYHSDGLEQCVNSWGEDYGDNGHFYLPAGYPISEMWAIEYYTGLNGDIKNSSSWWIQLITVILNFLKRIF